MMDKSTRIFSNVVITGATDGIGLELAKYYKQSAKKLCLIGKRKWEETPLVDFFDQECYCQVNLQDLSCGEVILEHLKKQSFGPIDLLIHNAATAYFGPIEMQSQESIQSLITVNLKVPIYLTHAVIPFLQEAESGKIVFIGSAISEFACPNYAVYAATKAALDGFARSLRWELAPLDIQIIYPGATRTGIHKKCGMHFEQKQLEKFGSAQITALKIATYIAGKKSSVSIGLNNKLIRFLGYYFGNLLDYGVKRSQK